VHERLVEKTSQGHMKHKLILHMRSSMIQVHCRINETQANAAKNYVCSRLRLWLSLICHQLTNDRYTESLH